jgi:surface carbohydrate biosynthesis protein (TIGR04326 family)
LLVTDAAAPHFGAATSGTLFVSWNTFDDANSPAGSPPGSSHPPTATATSVIHLGDLLHDQEESLQRRLLDWLRDAAEKNTAPDSPLPLIYPNLHGWWLLSITEKNYATTPQFTTLAKLMLLSEVATSRGVTRLDYDGSDRSLEAVLRDYALANGWTTNARKVPILRRVRRRTEPLQAVVHLARMFCTACTNLARRAGGDSLPGRETTFGIVGYLIPAAGDKRVQSPYWGTLPSHLASHLAAPDIAKARTLWLYHPSDELSPADARAYCRAATTRVSLHRTIDDFVTIAVWWRTLGTYRSFGRARHSPTLPTLQSSGRPSIPTNELFADQMRDSLAGSRAVWAMAHCHAYDALARSQPTTQWIFLWENKPFEHALTSAVQRLNEAHNAHGAGDRDTTGTATRTVGYAHSVVRRRDHRYFEEWRTSPRQPRQRPVASVYTVNGPLAHRNLLDIALPGAPVVEVEALRYSALVTVTHREPARLLVLGDISEYESHRLLEATSKALDALAEHARPDVEPWFKPHPGSPSHAEIARAHGFTITDEHLSALAPSLALAVVGAAGAASVDLALLGVPTATVLDACSMNLSPLVGVASACFVRSASELRDFIASPQLHGLAEGDLMHRAEPPVRWLRLLESLS